MRYLVKISYDGTAYHGFQRQNNALGIQAVIEKAFKLMTQTIITIHSAGRTDKGVHALGQMFHFDSDLKIDVKTWKRALNQRLPLDIRVISIKRVHQDFHARHHSTSKIYKYVIAKRPSNVFSQNYEVYVPNLKHIERIEEELNDLIGIHDFKGLCQHVLGKPTEKTMFNAYLKETKTHYIFFFHGNSFLKYMVRSIMGTVIEIGTGKKPSGTIKDILETKNRKLAGKTAEARGLYLVKINY